MRFRFLIAATAVTTVLAACATPESNPHYRYSTKYQEPVSQTQSVPTVQSADYRAPISYRDPNAVSVPSQPVFTYDDPIAPSTPQQDQPYVQSAGTVTQAGSPVSLPEPVTQTRTFEVDPTASTQSSDVMTETGGQNAGTGGSRIIDFVPVTQSAALSVPESPSATDSTQQVFEAPAAQGISYIVQESDTVYSLSKKTCSSLAQIKEINGLQADFLIKAGETIQLPASNC